MRIYKWDISVLNQRLMSVLFTETDESGKVIDSDHVLQNLAMREDIDPVDYQAHPERYSAWRRNSI